MIEGAKSTTEGYGNTVSPWGVGADVGIAGPGPPVGAVAVVRDLAPILLICLAITARTPEKTISVMQTTGQAAHPLSTHS
jgi:hypothetical protein